MSQSLNKRWFNIAELSRAGRLTAAVHRGLGQGTSQPIDISGRWPPPPPAPIQHMGTNGLRVWPSLLIRWFMPHKTDFCQIQVKLSVMIFWVPVYIFPKIRESRMISFSRDLMIEWIFLLKNFFFTRHLNFHHVRLQLSISKDQFRKEAATLFVLTSEVRVHSMLRYVFYIS